MNMALQVERAMTVSSGSDEELASPVKRRQPPKAWELDEAHKAAIAGLDAVEQDHAKLGIMIVQGWLDSGYHFKRGMVSMVMAVIAITEVT